MMSFALEIGATILQFSPLRQAHDDEFYRTLTSMGDGEWAAALCGAGCYTGRHGGALNNCSIG